MPVFGLMLSGTMPRFVCSSQFNLALAGMNGIIHFLTAVNLASFLVPIALPFLIILWLQLLNLHLLSPLSKTLALLPHPLVSLQKRFGKALNSKLTLMNQSKNSSAVDGMPTIATMTTVLESTTSATDSAATNTIEGLSTPPKFRCWKFLRGFELSSPLSFPPSPSASFSLSCDPLPSPPPLSSDPIAYYTLARNPSLIAVTSPIHIPRFVALLKKNPNPAFVSSVVWGFSHGFWPMASIPSSSVVNHPNHLSCSNHLPAITAFWDKEVLASRYSQPFSTLLPGM